MIARIKPGDGHGYGARLIACRRGSASGFSISSLWMERGCDTSTAAPALPVVLLHGNGSMIEDFLSSGIMDHAPPAIA